MSRLSYKDYQNVRDASWRVLLESGVDRLPVDLNAVCRAQKVRVLSYDAGAEVIEGAHLFRAARRTGGMALFVGGEPVILFDETQAYPDILFTVAHELGHLALGHIGPEGSGRSRWGPSWRPGPEERAADRFADRLLAPACVLWALEARTPEAVMELCRLPAPAAERRARRMDRLARRDRFLTAPEEAAVYRRFLPFILEARSACPPVGA